jgi:RsiW-degrading membrane proteinase PrsW (M82 family)
MSSFDEQLTQGRTTLPLDNKSTDERGAVTTRSQPQTPQRPHRSTRLWRLMAAVAYVGVAVGLVAIVLVGFLISLGPISFVAALAMAFVPVPFYAALVLTADRHEPEPLWAIGLALLWGGGVALFGALLVEVVAGVVVFLTAGEDVAGIVGMVAVAPFVEESAKGLGLLVVLFALRRQFDGVVDGIVYGAMIGLGFAAIENVGYYGNAVSGGGAPGGVVSFALRGVVSPFAHSLFTAMTGIGCGIARERRRGALSWSAPVVGFAVAVLLHTFWNGSALLTGLFFGDAWIFPWAGAYALGWVPLFGCFLAVAGFCIGRERRILRDQLTEEVALGALTREEYADVTSPARRLRFKLRSLRRGGVGGYVGARDFARTATRLALSKWHTGSARAERVSTRSLTLIPLLRQQLAEQRDALGR